MARKGLKIHPNTDDPTFHNVSPNLVWEMMHDAFGYTVDDLRGFMLNGLEGAWDDDAGKVAMCSTSLQGTPRNVAVFNGIMSYVLELDNFLGIDHTRAVVLPALFADAEHENDFDEVRLLEAMIPGYEIGRRMLDAGGGYSKHNSTGWHTTGTLGAMG